MTIETYDLAGDIRVCRILNGMWQASGAHGRIDASKAVDDMLRYHDFGLTSWDMADIYGPAETLFGKFRDTISSRNESELEKIVALTKFVPNPVLMTRPLVERAIRTSLQRMHIPTIDIVQFHWWDYQNPSYLDALRYLAELRDEGVIRHLALTNFDTIRMREISDAGFKFVSNQVQYSILDQRPSVQMESFCKKNKVGILAYGVLAGGFISERYLGKPEPSWSDLDTASLQKYKHMIDAWGGWKAFQQLLCVVSDVAKKYNVKIPNVAMRYILDKPQVAGVIIGTRLGIAEHRCDNVMTFDFKLDPDDRAKIDEIASKSHDLFSLIGDCGNEYRN